MATNVNHSNFQKCWRHTLANSIVRNAGDELAILISRTAGDKCYQLEKLEMLATNISKYNFQRCWRYMLAIIISRTTGDKC